MPPPPVPISVYRPQPADTHKWGRIVSLVGGTLVALSAGSNYAFSTFGPQLQAALHLTSMQINLIGLAGNFGVYLSGPVWGNWVDANGPRGALFSASILVALGFAGLASQAPGAPTGAGQALDAPTDAAPIATAGFWDVLVPFCYSLFTGIGNSGALAASLNAQAKSWGGERRGTATGIVLAGFGLSAAFFSTISSTFFAESARAYLRAVATISFLSFLLGVFAVRIHPPTDIVTSLPSMLEDGAQAPHPRVRALSGMSGTPGSPRQSPMTRPYSRVRTTSEASALPWTGISAASEPASEADGAAGAPHHNDVEAAPGGYGAISSPVQPHSPLAASGVVLKSPAMRPHTPLLAHTNVDGSPAPPHSPLPPISAGEVLASAPAPEEEVSGFHLFLVADFVSLFTMMSILAGAGLMLINNVGTITRTLYWSAVEGPQALLAASEHVAPSVKAAVSALTGAYLPLDGGALRSPRDSEVQRLQAQQVSAISIGNALGRVVIGVVADFAVMLAHGEPAIRVWLLIVVVALAVISQVIAAIPGVVTTVSNLLVLSSLTGLYYGTLFGLFPSLVLEFFGLAHFSGNWGIMAIAPIVMGNTFNIVFGTVYDAHARQDPTSEVCLQGAECYRSTFVITASCTVATCMLAAALVWRRGRFSL